MEVSVAEFAEREGISPRRVRQLIESKALPARRIGHAWLVPADAMQRPGMPVRPFSLRSVWPMMAALSGCQAVGVRADRVVDRRARLRAAKEPELLLAAWLFKRAERKAFLADGEDLAELRQDPRMVLSGVSHPDSGLLSANEVEGYIADANLEALAREYLLRPEHPARANVVLHVAAALPEKLPPLAIAADLAERGGYRERQAARGLVSKVLAK